MANLGITLLGEVVLYQTLEGGVLKPALVTKLVDPVNRIVNLTVFPCELGDDFEMIDDVYKGTDPGDWCFRPFEAPQ